ncbi:MAG: M28 family peptidase [Chloroflexota bacterium]|nr:MAG: M28 family peptidase [Chloroflexota bacterium]
MSAMDHIRHLAVDIGPRGSTMEAEADAARYAARVLSELGITPSAETFSSARSSYYPYALWSGLLLLAAVLFFIAGRIGAVLALLLSFAALISVLLELSIRPNPLRSLLPKGRSQNTWGRLEPAGEVRQQVVLIGHLDSHRTPLVFSSPGWLRLFRLLIPIELLASILLMVLYAVVGVGIIDRTPLLNWLALPFVLAMLGLFLLMIQADLTPYSAGANDNASGVGVILDLAERLKQKPLQHTAVWTLLSGCEEVGCYGAEAFAQAHRSALGKAPIWLTVDNVGGKGAGIAYFAEETFLLTARSDPALVSLADRIAKRWPDLRAFRHHFKGAYTEGAIGAKYGFRTLTFLAMGRDGTIPNWHQTSDLAGEVDPDTVERAEVFIWQLLQGIDGGLGS